MEENLKKNDLADNYREVALGICFGTGLGTVAGLLINNVYLGLSAGGVLGILIGCFIRLVKRVKTK